MVIPKRSLIALSLLKDFAIWRFRSLISTSLKAVIILLAFSFKTSIISVLDLSKPNSTNLSLSNLL